MVLKAFVQRLLGGRYRLSPGGSYLSNMAIPPGLGYQRYLELYGEVGWLYGAVSLIANAVASVEWSAYQQLSRGETKDLEDHIILDLLDKPNPFQTRYQFTLLLQTYLSLIGEAFIVLEFTRLRKPGEMWLAPPGYMSVIPSEKNYISHYEYRRGNTTIRLEREQVIHLMDPNPANPYRGTGAARSIGVDIDAEYYASRYQQRLFYNDAMPGLIMEFPDTPPKEERENLRLEFLETHQGWRNARRPAFLWGGAKANTIALAPKDMEFERLRLASKKAILGAYHIPDSLIGASEVGSRARAEADEYIFAKYTILPALMRIREALNQGLCPFYDETLRLHYADPVPQDVMGDTQRTLEAFKAGALTREETRTALGYDAKPESGDSYLLPFSVIEQPAKSLLAPILKQDSRWSEEQKEAYWQVYRAKTEAQEKPFHRLIRNLWEEQEKQVVASLDSASTRDTRLFDEDEAKTHFSEAFLPLIRGVFQSAMEDIFEGHEPKPAHTAALKQGLLNEHALKWIRERSLLLAKLLNNTTIEELRATLAEGFELGESVPELRKRIEVYYGRANRVRATMVARTEVIAASAQGNLEAYQEIGAQKVEFYPAFDERTCEECMAVYNGDRYRAVSESSGVIPVHVNCLLPDNLALPSGLISSSRARYEGIALELITGSGHRLTVTPNHMILTPQGFVKADALHEGDDVIDCLDSQRIADIIDPDNNQIPTRIQEIWNSILISEGSTARSVPTSPVDFHGDAIGFNGNVDIVFSTSLLGGGWNTLNPKKFDNFSLGRRLGVTGILSGYSPGFQLGNRGPSSDDSSMGGCSKCGKFLVTHPGESQLVSLAPSSDMNASIKQSFMNYNSINTERIGQSQLGFASQIASNEVIGHLNYMLSSLDTFTLKNPIKSSGAYPKLASKFLRRFSSLITTDKVIKIRDFLFSGHVYDLQSMEQLYISPGEKASTGGLILKNCRCVWLPVIE